MDPLHPLQNDFAADSSFEKKGITYSEDQIISERTIRGCVFINCVFEKRLHFENVDFGYGVKFIECKFDGLVGFSGCRVTNYDIEFNSQNQSIELSNCEFSKTLSFVKGNHFDRDLLITSGSRIKRLIIKNIKIEKGSIKIIDSSISEFLDINDATASNDFRVSNANLEGWIRISNLSAGTYTFSENTCKARVMIWSGSTKTGVIFNNGLYYDEIEIKALKCEGGLTIFGDTFKKSFNVICYDPTNKIKGAPRLIDLKNCSFEGGFYLDGILELPDRIPIDGVKIEASSKLSGIIHIRGVVIQKSVLLSGVNKEANIVFEFCQIQKITIQRFSNHNQLQFIHITSTFQRGTEFRIEYSFLGSTLFHGVSLDSFELFGITDSILNEIYTASVKWFDPMTLIRKCSTSEEFSQSRDLFRQLKFAMLKQGDRVQALFFKKYEMLSLKNELRLTDGNLGEKIMMLLNKSNDYGQKWIRPAFIGFACTCILYIPLIISTAPELTSQVSLKWDDIIQTLSVLPKYWYIIFKLLNPAHYYEKLVPNIRENGFGLFLDYFQRIQIAYFIFQVVSAFRKYIKE
jgi:hypothetical protein